MFQYAEYARHGNLAVSGAVNDQTQCLLDAIQMIWSDEAQYRMPAI